MSRKSICFVDDDPAEIKRFKAALGTRFIIGAGQSIDQALKDLRAKGGRGPALFLLDLFYPEGAQLTPEQRARLHDERRALLKAQSRFRQVLAELGQTTSGGFTLAHSLRRRSRAPFAFFTRKGALEDAIDAYDQGAVAVIKKPDPNFHSGDDASNLEAEYDRAAREAANLTAGHVERAIQKTSFWQRRKTGIALVAGFVLGVASSETATALHPWISKVWRALTAN